MKVQKINELIGITGGNYLEIGVYFGETISYLAEQHRSRKIYGIDPYISDGWTGQHKGTDLSDIEEQCKQKLQGLDNVTLFRMTSKKFLDELVNPESYNIRVVFVDGSHWIDDVNIDTKLAMTLIGQKKGYIIYDDLHIEEVRRGIKEALNTYPNLKRIEEGPVLDKVGMFYSVN